MRQIRHIHADEMLTLLREAYAADSEKSFLQQMARSLRDPATAFSEDDHWRPHPILATLVLTIGILVGLFFCFSLFRP